MCGGNGAQPFKFQNVINKGIYVCLTEDLQRDLITLLFKRDSIHVWKPSNLILFIVSFVFYHKK